MGRGEGGRGRERREIVPSHLALWDWASRGDLGVWSVSYLQLYLRPSSLGSHGDPTLDTVFLPIASSGTGTEIDKPFLQSAR